jgi:hypothetical protein
MWEAFEVELALVFTIEETRMHVADYAKTVQECMCWSLEHTYLPALVFHFSR